MKTTNLLFFIPSITLLAAWVMKINNFPNHLLLMAGGLFLMLIFMAVFLIKAIKQSTGFIPKAAHVFFFLLCFIILVLPFAGMFQQGPLPVLIYGVMVVGVMIYFIKSNTYFSTGKNFLSLANYRNFVAFNLLLVIINSPYTQILPDYYYSPAFNSKYIPGKGPEIFIDEAHNNYHTYDGLYTTFSHILRKDGYVVKPFSQPFSAQSLRPVKMLVISNAINKKNENNWQSPVYPAFHEKEIEAIKAWVKNGGSLFLIADHPPFSIAAKNLGAAFGFMFSDKTAEQRKKSGSDLFCRQNKMLVGNEITDGNGSFEYIDSIVTFTGQAFNIPDAATSILRFNSTYAQYALVKGKVTAPEEITGLSQGAYMKVGRGRLVVFGEAAMFTGQLGGGLSWFKVGMNAPQAKNNYKLLLNIIHWLDSK